MKNSYLILSVITAFMTSCSNSPNDIAQSNIKDFLKKNLKNPSSYESISFSKLDTLEKADTSESKQISLYKLTHIYSIANSVKDKAKMTISFLLDKDLKVTELSSKSINGDYSILTGNVYWKYNTYVGNKPDAGAEVTLYSLDTIRGNLKFETTADVQGNFKIDKILPGNYFLKIRSENTTSCPEYHISNLKLNSAEIKKLFNFDIYSFKTQLDEINKLDSAYVAILLSKNEDNYSALSAKIRKYTSIESEMRDKSAKLIEAFPLDFKKKIGLYSGYSNSLKFTKLTIEEGKTENKNTDFGTTCI